MTDLTLFERVFSGKRLLLTGSSGFVASGLLARIKELHCHVRCVTRSTTPPAAMKGGCASFEHVTGDIRERSFWRRTLPDVNFVFHLAAQTSVYAANQNPPEDWQANVLPMLNLLETCREQGWRPGILFAGSVTECGLPSKVPVNETQPDRPVTVYDWHKLLAESYLKHYVGMNWANGATLRLANIYGPGTMSGKPDRGILNQMMKRALRNDPLTLHGEGRQLRDYLFISDVAEAFVAAAVCLDKINGQHLVIGSGEGHTLAQAFRLVGERVTALTGREVSVNSVEPPKGLSPIEERDFVSDSSLFASLTGWSPQVPLVAGIDLTLKSFQAAVTTA